MHGKMYSISGHCCRMSPRPASMPQHPKFKDCQELRVSNNGRRVRGCRGQLLQVHGDNDVRAPKRIFMRVFPSNAARCCCCTHTGQLVSQAQPSLIIDHRSFVNDENCHRSYAQETCVSKLCGVYLALALRGQAEEVVQGRRCDGCPSNSQTCNCNARRSGCPHTVPA